MDEHDENEKELQLQEMNHTEETENSEGSGGLAVDAPGLLSDATLQTTTKSMEITMD